MKFHYIAALVSLAIAEVPQEHSHDLIINAVRPVVQRARTPLSNIDVIFGTLANPAGARLINETQGLGETEKDPSCLHQNLADLCMTEAKKTNNRQEMAACIQYRALERNTLVVGQPSALCTQQPINQELQGLRQHQDPAGQGATENNKQVEIEVAKRIKALGFTDDEAVNFALRTSTFTPGSLSDTSGRANTCDGPIGVDPQTLSGAGFNVFADQDGEVFGLRFRTGQQIDCSTLATAKNLLAGKMVPAATREELLNACRGTGLANPAATGNQSAQPAPTGNQQATPSAQPAPTDNQQATPSSQPSATGNQPANVTNQPTATNNQPTQSPAPTQSKQEEVNGNVKTVTMTQTIDCSQTPLPGVSNQQNQQKQQKVDEILQKANDSQQKINAVSSTIASPAATATAAPTVDPRVAQFQKANDDIKKLFDDLTKQTADAADEAQRLIRARAPQSEIDLAFQKAVSLDDQKDLAEARFDQAKKQLADAKLGKFA